MMMIRSSVPSPMYMILLPLEVDLSAALGDQNDDDHDQEQGSKSDVHVFSFLG